MFLLLVIDDTVLSDTSCSFLILEYNIYMIIYCNPGIFPGCLILNILKCIQSITILFSISVLTVLFHYLQQSFRQIHNSICLGLAIFLSKITIQHVFCRFPEIKFSFSLKEFYKEYNKW